MFDYKLLITYDIIVSDWLPRNEHVTVGAKLKPELPEIRGSEDTCCITKVLY